MIPKSDIRTAAARLQARLGEGKALPVEADILQPAATLLDLYGEDIRARAYVTADPIRGEQMLRPDFTLPVVQMHIESGAATAQYTYAGEVFRRQERASDRRPSEFLQVGLELFGEENRAAADADVFSRISAALDGLGLQPVIGDIGLLTAALAGLGLSAPRHAALLRHIWRPHRFRALLERFAGQRPLPPERAALLDRLRTEAPEALIAEAGPHAGLRSVPEIAARLTALSADAADPPLSAHHLNLIDELLAISAPPDDALVRLRDISVDLPTLAPALDRLAARFGALRDHGIDLNTLRVETAFGRTTLEYYDGFVFGFLAPHRPDLPPVASGGRYDALTGILGDGVAIPAVGGVIRPGLVLELSGAR